MSYEYRVLHVNACLRAIKIEITPWSYALHLRSPQERRWVVLNAVFEKLQISVTGILLQYPILLSSSLLSVYFQNFTSFPTYLAFQNSYLTPRISA